MAVKFGHQSQSDDILKAVRSIGLKSYRPGRIQTKETGFFAVFAIGNEYSPKNPVSDPVAKS